MVWSSRSPALTFSSSSRACSSCPVALCTCPGQPTHSPSSQKNIFVRDLTSTPNDLDRPSSEQDSRTATRATMWPLRSPTKYQTVPIDEEKCDARSPTPAARSSQRQVEGPSKPSFLVLILIIVFLALLSVGVFLVTPPDVPYYDGFIPGTELAAVTSRPRCAKRQEWRTLSSAQQQAYISAVLCLRDQPSVLAPASNRTSYDDFPWIHSHVGYFTHNAAPFLPWHRYFLHIYETALRDTCGYTGGLVYWDWTQDAAALEKSPVFDAATGFGGDGEVGGEITVGRSGRCVVDGPFAGVTADYYDVQYRPHCLSRGFRDDHGSAGHIDGHEVRPESIEEVLREPEYEGFVALMESRVHDAIPFGIAGDFETFTAPYGSFIAGDPTP
nr:tyrosinase ustq [Quercus suber]